MDVSDLVHIQDVCISNNILGDPLHLPFLLNRLTLIVVACSSSLLYDMLSTLDNEGGALCLLIPSPSINANKYRLSIYGSTAMIFNSLSAAKTRQQLKVERHKVPIY